MMRKKLGITVVAGLAMSLLLVGTASAGIFMKESRAIDRFDRLALGYQRHLTSDSPSKVECERVTATWLNCNGRWKVTAVSDENVLTRFTFKARGSVSKQAGSVVAKATFVKWETVGGTTRRTSSVNISRTSSPG